MIQLFSGISEIEYCNRKVIVSVIQNCSTLFVKPAGNGRVVPNDRVSELSHVHHGAVLISCQWHSGMQFSLCMHLKCPLTNFTTQRVCLSEIVLMLHSIII